MSEKAREFAEIPQQFVKEGTLVSLHHPPYSPASPYTTIADPVSRIVRQPMYETNEIRLDYLSFSSVAHTLMCELEYIQLCRAVAVGFAVMGFIGYIVKLIHIPM
jgi:preprotein translocase subunit Sss1